MAAGEVREALALLFPPGSVVELRAFLDGAVASGYFDDPAALAAAAEALDAAGAQGVYVTLNEVNPALLSRRANRVKARLAKADATTADGDILRRRWFPVDVDPVRPSGIPSRDAEHEAALARAREIADYLRARGWPDPVLADSGNGAHLLYRVDLPNDGESRDLVRRALEALDLLFSDETCTVDTANHNAARIWRLYGTTSRKGDHTPDRPHRRARLLSAPESPAIVGERLLADLAASLPPPPAKGGKGSAGHGPARDLRSWLLSHGIGIAREKPYAGGTLFVLEECPFSDAHRDGAFAIQFENGAIFAGCHHASCGGGAQRWQELRERLEGKGRERGQAETDRDGRAVPAPGDQAEEEIPAGVREEALRVLREGDPLGYFLRTFSLDHVGDEVVAACLVMSLASRSVENTNGLHVSVSGESGKGKSHAFGTMLRQVPARFRLDGAMSNKALFYHDGIRPGSVIVLDDRAISEEMGDILKGVTTSFCRPFVYRTVNKDRRPVVCTIPERCVWWVAKVEGAGDDQVFNRMLTCWIDDSEEQDARVLARVLARAAEPPGDAGEERHEIAVCRAMWEVLGSQRFHVTIPFAGRIRFRATGNRRNPEMLLDLVKAHALVRRFQRETRVAGDGTPCILAAREDFEDAARLYAQLNGVSGGQETKLTKKEADLLGVIANADWQEFTIPMLQKATGWSNGTVHKVIHGYLSRGRVHSGLLEKCPAISVCDRTVATEEEGGVSVRRRVNAYAFDRDLYARWCSAGAGAVWLEEGGESGGDGGNGGDGGGGGAPCSPETPCTNPEARAAGFDSGGESISSKNTGINPRNGAREGESCNVSGVTYRALGPPGGTPACTRDPGNVSGHGSNPVHRSPIVESVPQEAQKSLHQCAAGAGRRCRGAGNGRRARIDPRDFWPLGRPERRPCSACGSGWSHYAERLPGKRGRHRRRDARRICGACYAAARKALQERAVVLPGTFDPGGFEPLKADAGRCTVCGLERAVFIDRGTGTKVCGACHGRIAGGGAAG
ncbi:MAG: hypothetical protein QFX32_06095 [Methanolinea sp.]|nr:hypothetical protein [Methanolinea sp.]